MLPSPARNRQPLRLQACPCAVPIIPLPGTTLPSFASRHAAEWFHRSTDKLWYQSQFLASIMAPATPSVSGRNKST
jgi:hypothetical protein